MSSPEWAVQGKGPPAIGCYQENAVLGKGPPANRGFQWKAVPGIAPHRNGRPKDEILPRKAAHKTSGSGKAVPTEIAISRWVAENAREVYYL
jgi:hypothetical protein